MSLAIKTRQKKEVKVWAMSLITGETYCKICDSKVKAEKWASENNLVIYRV